MKRKDRRFLGDQLRGNQQACNAIAERVDKYLKDDMPVAATEIVAAILALAEAVRILVRAQVYQD